ncbi:MAG TPA: DUF2795 domain-containing protein [Pseudonocardia sp.]
MSEPPQPPARRPLIGERQLRHSLDGVRFPAPKWQLVACADYNGTALPIRLVLWQLPERTYRSVGDVVYAVQATTRDLAGAPSTGRSPQPSAAAQRAGAVRSPRAVPIIPLATRRRPPP